MTPAITLAGVTRRFAATTALADVSLEVGAGEMFGLIGPDGAGKTTAIRLMCGLLRPATGSIRVLGRDPVREHRHVTRLVGYLSQRFSLYGDLTVDENIAFFAEAHGRTAYGARRDQLLDMTRLAPFRRRLAGRLSGGMKQKLALACTLVHEPRVLILDEPTVALEAAYTRTNHVMEFVVPSPTGGLRTLYPDVPSNYATRLGLRWPVYTVGRTEALVRAARSTAGAAAEDARVVRADLRRDVARAFWALVSADAVVTVIARGVDRRLAHLSVAEERLAGGLVAPNEVASAQAQVSRQRMLLIEARNQRDLAGARLARLSGADVGRPVEAVATLAEPGAPPLPLPRLVDQALDARGERRAIEFRIEAANERVNAASRSMRPTVVVAGGVDLARPNPRSPPSTV